MTCITHTDRNDRLLVGGSITWRNFRIIDITSVDVLYSTMSVQATLSPLNIEQTLKQILASHEITLNDQRWLISLCLESSLSHQQEYLVNQVYEALRNGFLVVVKVRNT